MTIVCWQNGHKCQVRQMFLNPETGPGSVRCCWSVIAVRWCPSSESRSGGVHITPISLEFMVDISILNGVKHQRSHHWGAPPCTHYPRPVINTQRKLWQMTRILAGHVYIYIYDFPAASGSLPFRKWVSENVITYHQHQIIKHHTIIIHYQKTYHTIKVSGHDCPNSRKHFFWLTPCQCARRFGDLDAFIHRETSWLRRHFDICCRKSTLQREGK